MHKSLWSLVIMVIGTIHACKEMCKTQNHTITVKLVINCVELCLQLLSVRDLAPDWPELLCEVVSFLSGSLKPVRTGLSSWTDAMQPRPAILYSMWKFVRSHGITIKLQNKSTCTLSSEEAVCRLAGQDTIIDIHVALRIPHRHDHRAR